MFKRTPKCSKVYLISPFTLKLRAWELVPVRVEVKE